MQAGVVHLQRQQADPARRLVHEVEDLDALAGGGVGRARQRAARHPGHAGGHIADDLALRPVLRVDLRMREGLELAATAGVLTRPVVPVPAIGWLELDGRQRVADRVVGTPDQYRRRVALAGVRQLTDVEDPAEGTDVGVVVQPATGRTVAVDDAVLRHSLNAYLQFRHAFQASAQRRGDIHWHCYKALPPIIDPIVNPQDL